MIDWKHNSGIYLIAFYPSPETNGQNRYIIDCTYRALKDTYRCNIMVISDPKEANELMTFIPIIAIEEENKNTQALANFEHPEKAAYLVGNSQYRWPSYWFNNVVAKVHIPTPVHDAPLYGFQAASIVLNDRYIKNVVC
jgi:hypothetical protein